MELLRNVDLAPFTSIRIGGKASFFASVRDPEALRDLIFFAREKDLPLFVLGGGSNTVFGDVEGLVLNLRPMKRLKVVEAKGGLRIEAGAGVPLREIVSLALREKLKGFYRLSGFPATMGGAVTMNAGAFGVEVADFLETVTFMDWEGKIHRVGREELDFGYRRSPFPGSGVVLSCELFLEMGDTEAQAVFEDLRRKRNSTQPLRLPTSGSTFKNPPGAYAGKLLEEVGMKGYRIGGVAFSEVHANFLVNCGGGSFGEVLRIVEEAKRRVREEFGIELEEEVRLVEGRCSDGWKVL